MKLWSEYTKHEIKLAEHTKKKVDSTIYTFDIETTSYIIHNGKILPAVYYDKLNKKEQQNCLKGACMYIWMFSINDQVYYGRTWDEFRKFMQKLKEVSPNLKIVYVHNLAFEFQFIKSILGIDEVYARNSHKPMKALCNEFNIEFRCSYILTNCALAGLPKLFNLPVEKKVGDLNYNLLRNRDTPLTELEMGYCEYDCLVVYEYIKYELLTYHDVYHIPLTSTGHVRKELKDNVRCNKSYKERIRKAVNTNGHIYNLLLHGFAGGFTHANYIYADFIIHNVTSWDFSSSYPYCMVAYKYPMTKFREVNLTRIEDMREGFAYLVKITFKNMHSKYCNNFISKSKCVNVLEPIEDNGRILTAEELTIVLTDVDLRVITKAYSYDEYIIEECYYSVYKYLPKEFINFILDKYEKKTKYKNDKEHELEYSKEKSLFNSLYGMTVTNTIRPDADFINGEWVEIPLNNSDILDKLNQQEKDGFLSFSTGVWVTAYARANLQENIIKLDEYVVYCDTDSIKVKEGYDVSVIEEYNKSVLERIDRVSKELNIPKEKYMPKDIKGIERPLGVFDNDGVYTSFITQGAKKYCYETEVYKSKFKDNEEIDKYRKKNQMYINYEDNEKFRELHITVSGVPKGGVRCLNGDIYNFRDDLVFEYEYTNKNTLLYCEGQQSIELVDYLGNKSLVKEKSGVCILPTTYILGKAEEYMDLLDDSTERQKYKEGV